MTKFMLIPLLTLTLPHGAWSAEPTCGKTALDELNRDKGNTAYYLDATADRICSGKTLNVKGSVRQVYNKDELEIIAADGLVLTALLTSNHGCPDLLNVHKGDNLSLSGTVTRVYRTVGAVRLKDASCR